MTRVATGWLVYRLTGSALLLGVVGFAGQIPTFLLGPFAGVWVDRWDRHRVLVVDAGAVHAPVAGAGGPGPHRHGSPSWTSSALSVFQGVINAFDMPARQAFVVEMVERREDLPNAIALNSSMVNGGAADRPVAGRRRHRRLRRGLVLPHRRHQLPGGDRLAAADAAARAPGARGARSSVMHRTAGGLALRRRVPAHPRPSCCCWPWSAWWACRYTVLMPIFASQRPARRRPHAGLPHGAPRASGALAGAAWLASRKSVRGLGRRDPHDRRRSSGRA